MLVNRQKEALFIACEMEKRAVLLYDRAQEIIADENLKPTIAELLRQEREHLKTFSCMFADCDDEQPLDENALLLSAEAAQIIFPGGLMQFSGAGAFSSPEELLRFAATAEEKAVSTYTAFAEACHSSDAAKKFLAIAREERSHLDALRAQIEDAEKQQR